MEVNQPLAEVDIPATSTALLSRYGQQKDGQRQGSKSHSRSFFPMKPHNAPSLFGTMPESVSTAAKLILAEAAAVMQ